MLLALVLVFIGTGYVLAGGLKPAPAPNGIQLPVGYEKWSLLAPSHRTDNNTIRVVLGNDVAMEAARVGNTNPWPDGSILAKIVWKDAENPDWPKAVAPGDFVHAEFMIKDAGKFAETGGWGFARWKGLNLAPYGDDASFVQECYDCHLPVKENDYVFSRPAPLPR